MRLTKDEKTAMFKLLDIMTEQWPEKGINKIMTEKNIKIYWNIFRKLRLELKGF